MQGTGPPSGSGIASQLRSSRAPALGTTQLSAENGRGSLPDITTGEGIQARREMLPDISVRLLAKAAGMSTMHIWRVESGHTEVTSNTQRRVAAAFRRLETSPGIRIRARRRALGIGCETLATAAGLTQDHLEGIELGNTQLTPDTKRLLDSGFRKLEAAQAQQVA